MDLIPVMKPYLGDKEIAAAAAAISSGWVAQGPRVAEFEARFAEHVGAAAAVAVSSCTTGLHLLLHAHGIGAGDEVVVPSLSFIASSNAPRYVGARPVFADVERTTLNMTAASIEAVLTPHTSAVIAVHQIGMPLDLDPIRKLCDARDVLLIEDAACAIGSTYKGTLVGSGPNDAAFSFHPRKVLTTGEGGMITTNDPAFATRLRRLRQHAMSVSAHERHEADAPVIEAYPELGFNFRMTDIQAAIGLVQLAKLEAMVERRRELATAYTERLAAIAGLEVLRDPEYGTTNYQSYSVIIDDPYPLSRDELMTALHNEGIATRRGVMASHREPTFADDAHPVLPVTDYLADHTMILPLYHEMTESDVDRVVAAVATAAV